MKANANSSEMEHHKDYTTTDRKHKASTYSKIKLWHHISANITRNQHINIVDSQAAVSPVHNVQLQVYFTSAHQSTIRMPTDICSGVWHNCCTGSEWLMKAEKSGSREERKRKKRKDYTFRRQFHGGQENECLSQWGAWLVWMPSASALQEQCDVDTPCPSTSEMLQIKSGRHLAQPRQPGRVTQVPHLTNAENCLATRTALGTHAERDYRICQLVTMQQEACDTL